MTRDGRWRRTPVPSEGPFALPPGGHGINPEVCGGQAVLPSLASAPVVPFLLARIEWSSLALFLIEVATANALGSPVLHATRHTQVMQRTDELRALVGPFLELAARPSARSALP